MAIRGAEGLSDRDIAGLLDQGARIVVFSYCISIVVLTFRRSATVLVRPGQSALSAGLPYTALSFVAGWWGFPFGFIYTPMAIFQNLSGGKDVTDRMRAALGQAPARSALPASGRAVVVVWPDGQSYPGMALAERNGQVHVRFGNGRDEWVPADKVRAA